MNRKELYWNDYMSLFNDWTIWLSDWVWYIDTLEKKEVIKLYNALTDYFNN
jgi:hypothetical protein